MNTKLPKLTIKGFEIPNPIIQGGMGVGVSLSPLAGAVAREGGLGVISSAALKIIVSKRARKKLDTYDAIRMEIERAKDLGGGRPIGINIMCAIARDYEVSVRASIDAGVDAIISGAGLPTSLPKIQDPKNTALIPIVSSARALKIIIARWEQCGYRPDAVVLEGPLAGGHLGFKFAEIEDPEFQLEKLLPPVLDLVAKHGNIPVVVAGGIYTHKDLLRFLEMGASGVQMGTRFLATEESSATNEYKQAVISVKKEGIVVVAPNIPNGPASPCCLPFRIIKGPPANRPAKCNLGYLLQKGPENEFSECLASQKSPYNQNYECLCNRLLASGGCAPKEPPIYTVGTNAYRVDKILSVAMLMAELRGEINQPD